MSLGDRLMDIHINQQGTRWTPEMDVTAARIYTKPEAQAAVQQLLRRKTLGELTSPTERAMWIRAYDEAHHPRNYPVVAPEGGLYGGCADLEGRSRQCGVGLDVEHRISCEGIRK